MSRKLCSPEFRRQFCDDQLLRKTLQELAGKLGTALLDRLKQPAHRADIFRCVYHFQHGGLYLDIKCGFVVPWQRVLEHLAADWSTAHSSAAQRAGYNPAPAGQLPGEFMVMAIGVKPDHIFQGIIYHKPNHPLLRQAIQHAFGRQVFAAKANLEHMILCKYLWEVLKKDMGRTPAVGWNVSPTCGPIYLFQERRGRKPPLCDGQWHDAGKWQKGFQGDPTAKERTDKMLQSNLAASALRQRRQRNGAQLNPARGTAHSHEPTSPSYAGGHFELRGRGRPRQHLLEDHGTGGRLTVPPQRLVQTETSSNSTWIGTGRRWILAMLQVLYQKAKMPQSHQHSRPTPRATGCPPPPSHQSQLRLSSLPGHPVPPSLAVPMAPSVPRPLQEVDATAEPEILEPPAQEGKGHSAEPKIDPAPTAQSPVAPGGTTPPPAPRPPALRPKVLLKLDMCPRPPVKDKIYFLGSTDLWSRVPWQASTCWARRL